MLGISTAIQMIRVSYVCVVFGEVCSRTEHVFMLHHAACTLSSALGSREDEGSLRNCCKEFDLLPLRLTHMLLGQRWKPLRP